MDVRTNFAELWKSWEKTGKQTFITECKKLLTDINQSEEQTEETYEKERIYGRYIYELLKQGCKGTMKKDKIISTLHSLVGYVPQSASIIADIFSTVDNETSAQLCPEGLREAFVSIAVASNPFLGYLLMERFDADSVMESGSIYNKNAFNTRFIRLKTKMYYKQQKFNLFREESEGYAKLISELSEPSATKSVAFTSQVIHCLIGRFNLDPNRVIDIVLESFESQPDSEFFTPLLRTLNPSPDTLCELIGFKLTNSEPSDSLFTLIALLLQHDVFTMEDIYPWLTPDDRVIQKQWDREIADSKEYARRSMIVTINKEATEDTEVITSPEDRYSDNQKFLLCEALLSIGALEHALSLIRRLPDYSCVSNKRISTRLIQLLHYILDPIYKEHSNLSPKLGHKAVSTYGSSDRVHHQIFDFNDLEKNINAILAIGPYIYHDPVLLYKLLRLMKSYLQKTKTSKPAPLYFKFLTLMDEVVLPCLCFLEANCSASEEIWTVIKFYPYYHRFRLYASWKGDSVVLLHPVLLKKRVDLVKRVKHLMRRISKENVKPMGRLLGKLSHSMPAVIFDYILSQIQLFDNLITPVIDALKFLTSLSYDVLVFCLLEALSPSSTSNSGSLSVMLMPNRPRTKHDGSTIAPWIQSLSSFAGSICKKYSIELVPLLQYIANQLKNKQSLDLLLLKEIVQKMTGIEAAEEMTSEQLDAMAGGEMLRGEAGYFGQVRTAKKSAGRLREASSMNDLAVTLCILMAQQRNCIVYDESQNLHTKLVGKLYDQCQDTLVQFGSFLATSCTLDDYARKIPPLQKLVEEYHISSDVAFFLWRPLFAHSVSTKYDELRRAEKSHKNLTVVQRQQKYAQASHFVLNPVIETMRNFLTSKTWEDISPQFYVTFWSLTLYDLHVPTEAYAREVTRVKQIAANAGDNKDMASSKRKKEQERCNALIEKLQDEERRQTEHVDRVMAKLNQEKDSWFASRAAKSAKNEAVTAFLQLCLFPRCIFTAPDALYCAHFVNTIHSLSTPNFSTLICYDRIFCDIIYTVTSCTENEANRYGRFLCALLGTVMKWHSDKSIFDKECSKFPGFVTKFRAANASSTESSDHVDYENFRHVCHKWHYKITKCVIVCLESKDFIQIRNSLIVLKRILPYYPKVSNLANAVERWIERVRTDEKEKRQDLFALATSYIGQLKSKWTQFVVEEDFHQKAEKVEKASPEKTNSKKSVSTKDEKSVPAKDGKKKATVKNENHVVSTSAPGTPTSNSVKVSNGSSSNNSTPKSTSTTSSSHPTTKIKAEPEKEKEKEKEKDKEKEKEKDKEKDKSRERNSTRDRRRDRNNEERSSKKGSEKNSDNNSSDVKDKSSSSQSGRRDSIDGTSSSSRRSLDTGETPREAKRRKVDNQISKTYRRSSSKKPQVTVDASEIKHRKSKSHKKYYQSSSTKTDKHENLSFSKREQAPARQDFHPAESMFMRIRKTEGIQKNQQQKICYTEKSKSKVTVETGSKEIVSIESQQSSYTL